MFQPHTTPVMFSSTNPRSFMSNISLATLALAVAFLGMTQPRPAIAADGPPSIIAGPTNRTVLQGSATTFTVVADGTAPLNYQWLKDGAAILGANAASYTITSAQPGDEGNYSVRVTNALDAAFSGAAEFL